MKKNVVEILELVVDKVNAFSEEAERGIPDMVELDKLNNATLLHNLKQRCQGEQKDIYTYVSPTLLVVNPFEPVSHLMKPEMMEEAKGVRELMNVQNSLWTSRTLRCGILILTLT